MACSWTVLVSFALLALVALVSAQETVEAPAVVRVAEEDVGQGNDWTAVLGCVFKDQVSACLQQRTMKAMRKWLETERLIKPKQELAAGAKQDADDDTDDDEAAEKDKGIFDQIGDFFSFGVSRFLQFVDDDEDDDKQEAEAEEDGEAELEDDEGEDEGREGRSVVEGRKKKKIQRLKALIKLLLLGKLIKEKIYLTLAKLGFLLQVKFFGIAVLNLLVNVGRLFFAWLKHKAPQKVIYYEHANHQHHYEHEHHHDYDHEDQHKGWFGKLWSRSFETPKVNVASPGGASHNVGGASASASYVQDYSVQGPQHYQANQQQLAYGQEAAYAGQKPQVRYRVVSQGHHDDEDD